MNYLREMQTGDIDKVLEVISSQDEDDAKGAEPGYRSPDGCVDQYVMEQSGRIIGVTGFNTPPGCDRTHWLSWTYVHEHFAGRGNGRMMLNDLIDHLKQLGGRKMFVKVSDYESEEDGAIYAAALHLYQSLGFSIELAHNDFYDEGEAQMILGLRLQEPDEGFPVEPENCPVRFNSVFEIAETDDAYSFGWHDKAKAVFTAEDLQVGLDDVKSKAGRAVFLSFPSNFIGIREPLLAVGFSESGQLLDYYEDGIHEQHFTFRFQENSEPVLLLK